MVKRDPKEEEEEEERRLEFRKKGIITGGSGSHSALACEGRVT